MTTFCEEANRTFIPDSQDHFQIIEDCWPLLQVVALLQVDESCDNRLLRTVEAKIIQTFHDRFRHGVAGAGGFGSLVGRLRCGSGGFI